MSMYFDRVARTFIFCTPQPAESVTIRRHEASTEGERSSVHRQRMRTGAREVLDVLVEAQRPLSFQQIQSKLRHVSTDTLQVRLSQLTAREDVERHGCKFQYTYALPLGSTFRST